MDLTESAEEKTLLEAIKTEQAPPESEKPAAEEVAAETTTETKPAAEASSEATKPAAEAPKKPTERPRLVPLSALHEARERIKAQEAELAAFRQKLTPQLQQPAIPDETQDPIGTITALKAKIAESEENQRKANEQMVAEQSYALKSQAYVEAYKAEHPEYEEQAQHLYNFRLKQLAIQYPNLPAPAHQQLAQREAQAMFREAIDNDVNPAELVAQHAALAGWQAKAADPAPTPTPTPDPKPAVEKIERLARGQKAATSSSGSGGGAERAELTIEELLELDGAAFDKASKAWIDAQKRAGI